MTMHYLLTPDDQPLTLAAMLDLAQRVGLDPAEAAIGFSLRDVDNADGELWASYVDVSAKVSLLRADSGAIWVTMNLSRDRERAVRAVLPPD